MARSVRQTVRDAAEHSLAEVAVSSGADHDDVWMLAVGDLEEGLGGSVALDDPGLYRDTGLSDRFGPARFEIVLEIATPRPQGAE
jgi:hypothetical protein